MVLGDRMRTCGSLCDEHMLKKSSAAIAYHDLADAPTSAIPSFFTAKTRIACYFCVEPLPDGGKVTRATIGSVKPWNFWSTKVHATININWLVSLGLTYLILSLSLWIFLLWISLPFSQFCVMFVLLSGFPFHSTLLLYPVQSNHPYQH